MTHLPEVAEHSATGSLRDLYADIRQVTGLSFVNLVYRHLATRQHVLEWTWTALRPHFVSGAVAAAASELRVAVEAVVRSMDATVPRYCNDLPADTAAAATSALRSYGVANSMNLVAFTALLHTDELREPVGPAVEPHHIQPSGLPPLPALPPLQDLAPEIVARIRRLNACADEANPVIVASLYRHLALWPDALEQAEILLAPLQQRKVLQLARTATVDAVHAVLRKGAVRIPQTAARFDREFGTTVGRFATVTIPKMLPIGALLQRAWQTPLPAN